MQLTKIDYQTKNETIQVVALEEHAWVTISDITQILNITQPAVTQHFATLEKLNQLKEGKHVITLPITQIEGTREVTRQIKHYSELAVIRIGFRVNSPEALAFQEWAAETLLTLKRDGVVFDTSAKPRGTEHLTDMEKWDYDVTHQLLNALNIPPMESLPARIGLLIDSYQKKTVAGKHSHTAPNVVISPVEDVEIAETFLSVIRDGLNAGELYLEGEAFPDYERPNDSPKKGLLIGFYSSPRNGILSVALFPRPAFKYVQSVLTRQGERLKYKKNELWAQLYGAGYINKVNKSKRNRGNIRYDAHTYNRVTQKQVRTINLEPNAVLRESSKALTE